MISFLIIIISLMASGFFSGIEMAFISSNRFQIELEMRKKSIFSLLLSKIYKNPRGFITSMLIGNNIALVIYGIYMGKYILDFLPHLFPFLAVKEDALLGLFLQTFFSAFVILITAEFFPKAFFGFYAYEMIKLFIIPSFLFYLLLSPVAQFVVWLAKGILKLSKEDIKNEPEILFDKKDLGFFISEKVKNSQQEHLDSEIGILHRALDFWQLKLRECMIPRKEIIAFELNTPIELIKEKFIKSGLSKIIIYKEDIDNIIGYVHYLELLKKPKSIGSILFPIESIHISMSAQKTMNFLIKKRKSIAIVLDEYGGTAGLITLEDLLEEFIGDIEDEHDKNLFIEKKINKKEFLFSARLEINYLNKKYKLDLPKLNEYETLGGLIVSKKEDIPLEGEKFSIEGIDFEIKKVSKNKIEEVLIRLH